MCWLSVTKLLADSLPPVSKGGLLLPSSQHLALNFLLTDSEFCIFGLGWQAVNSPDKVGLSPLMITGNTIHC